MKGSEGKAPVQPFAPVPFMAIRLPTFLAIVVSGYLIYQKLTGRLTSLVGCGAGPCSEILAGRWSAWFYIPVTVPALLMFCGIHLLSYDRLRMWAGIIGRWYLPAAGAVAILCALWFSGILIFVEKSF